jgi:hypothetical protein
LEFDGQSQSLTKGKWSKIDFFLHKSQVYKSVAQSYRVSSGKLLNLAKLFHDIAELAALVVKFAIL